MNSIKYSRRIDGDSLKPYLSTKASVPQRLRKKELQPIVPESPSAARSGGEGSTPSPTSSPLTFGMKAVVKLPPITESQPHSLAPFMNEITRFVQTQLQLLDRRYDWSQVRMHETSVQRHEEMEYLRQRREIFRDAQHMFTDSFTTYRLFLNAIDEENERYVTCLSEANELLSTSLRSTESQLAGLQRTVNAQTQKWNEERELLLATIDKQRREFDEFRESAADAAVRERASAPDLKRQLQELELRNVMLQEENIGLKEETSKLKRLTDALSLETFSDSLLEARTDLRDLTEQCRVKDEIIMDSNDFIEDLCRDLRRTIEVLAKQLQRPVSQHDIRLTKRGHDVVYGDTGDA